MKSKILGLLAVGLLAGPMTAQAVGVVVGGIEWRQLTETRGLSYNMVATVCSTADGVCSGNIGATSFDGWTWASDSDVQDLFEELIQPGSTQFPDITSTYAMANDPDIDAAIGPGAFTSMNDYPEFLNRDFELVRGFSRTAVMYGYPDVFAAWVPYLLNAFASDRVDEASLRGETWRTYVSDYSIGMWLYRAVSVPEPEPEPVPEPGAFALLCLGFAGLGFARRRKA